METTQELLTPPATADLIFTRIFDAPLEQVWRAWSEPEQVMRWWGPNGFTAPLVRLDFREGGTSLVCMNGHGFGDLYSTWTYQRIVPGQRIEYLHNLADQDGCPLDPTQLGMPANFPQNQHHTVAFEDLGGAQTKLTITEAAWPAGHMRELAKQGMEECLDKMAANLLD